MYYVLLNSGLAIDGPFNTVREAARCVDAQPIPEDFYTSSRWMLARKNPRYRATKEGNARLMEDIAQAKAALIEQQSAASAAKGVLKS